MLTYIRRARLSADCDAVTEIDDSELTLGHFRNMSGTTICTSPTSVSPDDIVLSTSPDEVDLNPIQTNGSVNSPKSEKTTVSKNRKEITSICDIIEKCKSSN